MVTKKKAKAVELREARDTAAALAEQVTLLTRQLQLAKQTEGDANEVARRGAERDAKELRSLREQCKALLDTCEKLIAVIALPTGPDHAQRRNEVLVEALASTRSFHPFA